MSPLSDSPALDALVPPAALALAEENHQKALPAIAKDSALIWQVETAVRKLPTTHELIAGDSRSMAAIPDASVHLVVTSPPYWTLKEYADHEAQLGHVEDYEAFLA